MNYILCVLIICFNKVFGLDNVPYPSQTGYNEEKTKKVPYEFPGSRKSKKSKVCDR